MFEPTGKVAQTNLELAVMQNNAPAKNFNYFSSRLAQSHKEPLRGGAVILHMYIPANDRDLINKIPARPYTGDGVGPAYPRDDDVEHETCADKSNGKSHPHSTDEATLVDLADKAVWVGWRTETRPGQDKATKVPFDPKSGRWAKSDDATTWGTLHQAREWARKSQDGDIGIELAAIGDGLHLGGIDLDTCRNPQTEEIDEWALAVIRRFASYTEVSPSGTGVKVFFVYRLEGKAELDKLFGGESKLGRQFKKSAKGDHPPAIEVYRGKRYFAVTGQQFATYANLRTIPIEDWRWLLQEAGPAFTGKKARAERTQRPRAADAAHDASRSGKAFREGARLKREGATYEEMVEALLNSDDSEIVDWVNEKGLPNDERELKRIYENADAALDEYASDQQIKARLDELIVERQKFAKDTALHHRAMSSASAPDLRRSHRCSIFVEPRYVSSLSATRPKSGHMFYPRSLDVCFCIPNRVSPNALSTPSWERAEIYRACIASCLWL
jgi:hypothetical protein